MWFSLLLMNTVPIVCLCLGKMNLLRAPWGGDTIEVIGNAHDNPELLK